MRYSPRSTIKELVPDDDAFSVLPLENSTFGTVTDTYNTLRDPRLGKTAFVRGEHVLAIRHCLITLPGVRMQDVTRVSSHEQVRSLTFMSSALGSAETYSSWYSFCRRSGSVLNSYEHISRMQNGSPWLPQPLPLVYSSLQIQAVQPYVPKYAQPCTQACTYSNVMCKMGKVRALNNQLPPTLIFRFSQSHALHPITHTPISSTRPISIRKRSSHIPRHTSNTGGATPARCILRHHSLDEHFAC